MENIKTRNTKIDLITFADEYKLRKSEMAKQAYFNQKVILIKSYIPTATKFAVCENIAKSTMYDTKLVNGKTFYGDFQSKSIYRYILFIMNLIDLYTSLQVDFSIILQQYDMLNEIGVIELIIGNPKEKREGLVPEKEFVEFQAYLNQTIQDIYDNEFEIHAFIKKQVCRIENITTTVLSPLINILSTKIEGVDESKIYNLGKKYIDSLNLKIKNVTDELK